MNTNLLMKNSAFFAKYICHYINASIHPSKIHVELKEVDIQPVHKKKSKLFKENYRPINILPNISKIYERCLYDEMSSCFDDIFFKTSMRFYRVTVHNIALPVSCDRKMEKNSRLWGFLWCIISRLI